MFGDKRSSFAETSLLKTFFIDENEFQLIKRYL